MDDILEEKDADEDLVKSIMTKEHMEEVYSGKNPIVNYVHNQRLEQIIKLIKKLLRKTNDRKIRILDAGCGEGQLLERMEKVFDKDNVEFYGVDITKIALEDAEKRTNHSEISLQNLKKMNFKDNFFDVITCTEVIEHIPDYEKLLEEIRRVLIKNGLFVLSFPNEALWTFSRFLLRRKPYKIPDHFNSFSPRQIIKKVNMRVRRKINIPFRLPSLLAVTRIIAFEN